MPRIAVIPGDGIGMEVVPQAVRVLTGTAERHGLPLVLDDWSHVGAERYLRDGVTLTPEEWARLAGEYDAVLLGALGDPRVEGDRHAREILLGLRQRLDLYVNFRPCVLIDPSLCPLRGAEERDIHIEIFRENTEGAYAGLGGVLRRGTADEVAIEEDLNTRRGVERIVRAAFHHAVGHGRPKVTLVDKANAMPRAGDLWRRVFREVAEENPGVEAETRYVDAMAMDLVRRPEAYSVVVTSNLFGDVLSDLAAAVTGGLGLAPSANFHPGRHALFEPVHGSAPDIAGRGVANPIAAIRCGALLLAHFGWKDAARDVERAVVATLAAGTKTPDLGGRGTTEDVGRAIQAALSEEPIQHGAIHHG